MEIMDCVRMSCEAAFEKSLVTASFLNTIFSESQDASAAPFVTQGAPTEGEGKVAQMKPWFLDRDSVLQHLKRRATASASGGAVAGEEDRADLKNLSAVSRQAKERERHELKRIAAAGDERVKEFADSVSGCKRGAAVEYIDDKDSPHFGKHMCYYCRCDQERLAKKSRTNNFQGGISTFAEREQEDEEKATEKMEAELQKAKNKKAAEEKKKAKEAEEAEAAAKVQRLTGEMTVALELEDRSERLERLEKVLEEGGFPYPKKAAKEALDPAKVAVAEMKEEIKAEEKAAKDAAAAAAKARVAEETAAKRAASAAAKEQKKKALLEKRKREGDEEDSFFAQARKIFAKPEGQQRKAFAALRKKMKKSDALAMELDD